MRISDWSSDVCSSDLNLEQLASTSTMLASNKDRIPEDFDERHIGSALNLLSHVDEHGSKIAETRLAILSTAEDFVSRLKIACKPLDDGIAPLEKAVRNRITDAMISQIETNNNDRSDRKSTRMNSSTNCAARMPSSALKTKTITIHTNTNHINH